MRRLIAFAMLIALAMGLVAPAVTGAQFASPTPSAATSAFGIPLGAAAPWIGPDGTPAGTITVTNITDPFQGYDASSAPQRGYHYALAEVTVTNTSTAPLQFEPSYVSAIDNEGFVASQPYISYSDPAIVALETQDALAPGASATGVIPYSLFGNATIQRMAYAPSYDRFIGVLDLRTAPVAIGTPVSVLGADGNPVAQVTVNSVADPFTGYDSSSAPLRGSSYAALDVTVTNTSSAVLSVSPSDFWLIDRDGFVISSTYVSRTDTTVPDYTYVDLNPGESQHGILVYPVFAGVPVAQVNYGDGYTTLTVVADVSAGSPTTGAPATNAATAPAPTAAATTAAVTSSPDCAGLVEWGNDLVARISRASEVAAPLQAMDPATVDPATVTSIASQLRTMGDEQAASNPPPAAAALNTLMTEQFYYALADAVDAIATGLQQQNATAAMVGQKAAQDVLKIFESGGAFDQATQAIATACPNEAGSFSQQSGS